MPYIHPTSSYRIAGQNTEFTCHSPKTKMWMYNGDPELPHNVVVGGSNGEILYIFHTQARQSGTYSCITEDTSDVMHILDAELVVVSK